jgi:hypothetical protein
VNALRRLKFLLAALAVALLQAGTPMLAYAKMASDGGLTRELCTPSGVTKFVVDADGNAREAQGSSGHGEHCALCSMAFAPPGMAPNPFPSSAAACGVIRIGQTRFQSGAAVAIPPATGPPSRS